VKKNAYYGVTLPAGRFASLYNPQAGRTPSRGIALREASGKRGRGLLKNRVRATHQKSLQNDSACEHTLLDGVAEAAHFREVGSVPISLYRRQLEWLLGFGLQRRPCNLFNPLGICYNTFPCCNINAFTSNECSLD
jgi:hypothetical protein